MFRLEDGCVINRMGMNNQGIDAFAGRLARLNRTRSPFVMVAANVGINKEAADPERDYPALVAAVSPYVHYVALNVSSPNTAGLRALQDQDRLRAILAAVSCVTARPPVLV
jgi:dihydroorotate dehydrogenase